MDEETRRWLEIGALQLAAVVVAAHLYAGLGRFVRQPTYGTVIDPRPVLFVLSSFAILAGTAYVVLGGRREPVYLLGLLTMLGFLLGYVAWHLGGHVGALPWVEVERTVYHDRGPVETIAYHLRTDRVELVSKLAEAALAALLAVLLVDARREEAAAGDPGEPAAADEVAGPEGDGDPESPSTTDVE